MTRNPLVEWQVCGICNYDCSYCIQSQKTRVGHPSEEEIETFLDFFEDLPRTWEIKMTGGEPFAFRGFMDRIVPGLVDRTVHTVSVLTNLSASGSMLERFSSLTRGRLGIVSASLHLEYTDPREFAKKASLLRTLIDDDAKLVINCVAVPGKLVEFHTAKAIIEEAGLRFFPQIMKVGHGVASYDREDRVRLRVLIGDAPSSFEANIAPSYRDRLCSVGLDYFVLTQTGDAFSCRTAKRYGEGHLGNIFEGPLKFFSEPARCPYDICPCSTPANRGMIEGVGARAGGD